MLAGGRRPEPPARGPARAARRQAAARRRPAAGTASTPGRTHPFDSQSRVEVTAPH